jgi:hypothetical protein
MNIIKNKWNFQRRFDDSKTIVKIEIVGKNGYLQTFDKLSDKEVFDEFDFKNKVVMLATKTSEVFIKMGEINNELTKIEKDESEK